MIEFSRHATSTLTFLVVLLALSPESDASVRVQRLPRIDTHASNVNVFSTPVAFDGESVYAVNVEAPGGAETGINLHTVVRKASRSANLTWRWTEASTVERRTLDDKFHTQASVAVDVDGYVHVAYNMHNMPWQYAVSARARDISQLFFRGDVLSEEELKTVKHQNKTPFPELGAAALPGSQVTYPAFFHDQHGELYVTYRFATRPARAFSERRFAGGVARYDRSTRAWIGLGAQVEVSSEDARLGHRDTKATMPVFAMEAGWTVYLVQLAFDHRGRMHASWTWRQGVAGPDVVFPSYAQLAPHELPLREPFGVQGAERVREKGAFLAATSLAVDPTGGDVFMIVAPVGEFRRLIQRSADGWTMEQPSPRNAEKLIIDAQSTQWAFAAGLQVLTRRRGESRWRSAYEERGMCHPKVLHHSRTRSFLVHTIECTGDGVIVYQISY